MLYGNWSLLPIKYLIGFYWMFTVFARCFFLLHIKATARSDVKYFTDVVKRKSHLILICVISVKQVRQVKELVVRCN